MRVGDQSFYGQFLSGLMRNRRATDRSIAALTDGKRVRTASDDPVAAGASLQIRGRVVRLDGYERSAGAARSALGTADGLLGEVLSALDAARAEALAGASGTSSEQGSVRATRVEALRAQMLSIANTSHAGRSIFAGTATLGAAFAADGTYLGNDAESQAPIDDDEAVGATVSGQQVFTSRVDVFAVLDDLAAALRDGRTADAATAAESLRSAISGVTDARGEIGARLERIDAARARHGDEGARLAARVAELEDADLAQVLTELQAAETGREALSATAARVLGRSLFDYLG